MRLKKLASLVTSAALAVSLAAAPAVSFAAGEQYIDGTYTAAHQGFIAPMTVSVTISQNDITDITIDSISDTATRFGLLPVMQGPNVANQAAIAATQNMIAAIKSAGSADVTDAVSGATASSKAFKKAVSKALEKATDGKTALGNLIAKVTAMDKSKYSTRSLSALSTALTDAQDVYNSGSAAQSEIVSAVESLQDAIDGLAYGSIHAYNIDQLAQYARTASDGDTIYLDADIDMPLPSGFDKDIYTAANYNLAYDAVSTATIGTNKKITIDGQGHTLDGNDVFGFFFVHGSELTLKNMTIKNANYVGRNPSDTYGTRPLAGSAVYVELGDAVLENCTIMNCQSMNGAVYVDADRSIKVKNCTFVNNEAFHGGALAIGMRGKGYVANSIMVGSGMSRMLKTYLDLAYAATGSAGNNYDKVYGDIWFRDGSVLTADGGYNLIGSKDVYGGANIPGFADDASLSNFSAWLTSPDNYKNSEKSLPLIFTANNPAIDKIPSNNQYLTPSDARGVPRPQNGFGDIGAFEMTKAATPIANPASSSFGSSINISLTCATDGAEIYYTTDGTLPSRSSAKYSAPINLTSATTIKAMAAGANMFDSDVAEFTYSRHSTTRTDTPPVPSGGTSNPTADQPPIYTVDGAIIKATGTAGKDGSTAVVISGADITKAADAAAIVSEKSGEPSKVVISYTAASTSSVETVIPGSALKTLDNKHIDSLEIISGDVTFAIDAQAIAAIGAQSAGDIKFSVLPVSEAALSDTQKQAANGHPVYNLGIGSGGKSITDWGNGKIEVSMKYTPKDGENLNAIVVYFMDSSGSLQMISNCKYNHETKIVTFTPPHFSIYVIGYNPVTFADVGRSHWGKNYIEQAAARLLVKGVGNNQYQPDRSVSRAEFVQMVSNVISLPSAKTGTDEYIDVHNSDWYYSTIMDAKSAGLLDAFAGSNFSPTQAITREEMAAILAMALRCNGIPANENQVDIEKVFSDHSYIGSKFTEDISLVCGAKIMLGTDDGKFDPQGLTTRAQAATVQIRLLDVLA